MLASSGNQDAYIIANADGFSRQTEKKVPRLLKQIEKMIKKIPGNQKGFLGIIAATQVCKPGSVLTAIYLVPQLLTGSSRLLEAVGRTIMLLHGVAPG